MYFQGFSALFTSYFISFTLFHTLSITILSFISDLIRVIEGIFFIRTKFQLLCLVGLCTLSVRSLFIHLWSHTCSTDGIVVRCLLFQFPVIFFLLFATTFSASLFARVQLQWCKVFKCRGDQAIYQSLYSWLNHGTLTQNCCIVAFIKFIWHRVHSFKFCV